MKITVGPQNTAFLGNVGIGRSSSREGALAMAQSAAKALANFRRVAKLEGKIREARKWAFYQPAATVKVGRYKAEMIVRRARFTGWDVETLNKIVKP